MRKLALENVAAIGRASHLVACVDRMETVLGEGDSSDDLRRCTAGGETLYISPMGRPDVAKGLTRREMLRLSTVGAATLGAQSLYFCLTGFP